MSYYLHRIQKENDAFAKGIEVHSSLNDAIRSFWGRIKMGYNNPDFPDMTFVACKIKDENGNVVEDYDKTWLKEPEENVFFLHSIQINGENVNKTIDVYATQDAAMIAFAKAMEYGYNNSRFPNVSFVSCEITDLLSGGLVLARKTWVKPESEQNQTEE